MPQYIPTFSEELPFQSDYLFKRRYLLLELTFQKSYFFTTYFFRRVTTQLIFLLTLLTCFGPIYFTVRILQIFSTWDCPFFSIRVFFHGHWRRAGQQRKGGYHLLFHSTTSGRSWTFRHLFATLHVRWLSHIFNRSSRSEYAFLL